jgi:hypothetical protein
VRRGAAEHPGQRLPDPQNRLIEQPRQFGKIARRQPARPDSRPAQPYFKLWGKPADRKNSS